MKLYRTTALLVLLTPTLAACTHAAALDAITRSKTTLCADLMTSYAAVFNLRTRLYQTGAQEMGGTADSTVDVTCREDGMNVKRSRDVKPVTPAPK